MNATSVNIKKDMTITENHYRIDEPFENTIENEELLELMLLWKANIVDEFKD